MKHKVVFKTKDNDEKEVELAALRPSPDNLHSAQRIYNQYFRDAINSSAMLRVKMEKYLKQEGLWTDDHEKDYSDLVSKIKELKLKLAKGGIKLSKARSLAVEIMDVRHQSNVMLAERLVLDSHTAEGQADAARLNYLISVCTVYNESGKTYFSDFDDFLKKMNDDVATDSKRALQDMIYDVNPGYEDDLPEYKFLKEHGFMNDKSELVDKDGHLVDNDGRKVDSEGRWVDNKDHLVDEDGNKIDKKGNLIIKFKPFIED